MNALTYRGYTAKIEIDAEEGILIGRILGIEDIVGFDAEDPNALRMALEEAVNDYLQACAEAGEESERPSLIEMPKP
ncbi:hypothetical protein [Aureimonas psammosilenae]|uniref:hypothetical protein n=1 Tax=Aureimonas psammosilenae TaxID=2495496 RepID=UPI0012613309|nr:hypothetical protein [Aureimonas psammosilenae]